MVVGSLPPLWPVIFYSLSIADKELTCLQKQWLMMIAIYTQELVTLNSYLLSDTLETSLTVFLRRFAIPFDGHARQLP